MHPTSPKRTSYTSRRKCLQLPAASWKYRTSQPQQYTTLGHSNISRLQMFCTARSLPGASTCPLRGMPTWVSTLSALIPQCINPTFHSIYSKAHMYISVPIHDLPAAMLQRRKHLIRSSTEYLKVRDQSELGYETSSQRKELTISTA